MQGALPLDPTKGRGPSETLLKGSGGQWPLAAALPRKQRLMFAYSDGRNAFSASTSHGGFDNDPNTMIDILKTILGTAPSKPFTKTDLGVFDPEQRLDNL